MLYYSPEEESQILKKVPEEREDQISSDPYVTLPQVQSNEN